MRVAVDSPAGRWRVAVARALGGSEWRNGGIIDTADVTNMQLLDDHRFLIVASDGIWGTLDEMSARSMPKRSRRIASQVMSAQAAGVSAGDVADQLVRCAAREGGTDNASCIVMYLNGNRRR